MTDKSPAINQDEKQLFARLLDCILESLEEHKHDELEAFEFYGLSLRMRLLGSHFEYKKHFMQGYKALLENNPPGAADF